MQILSVDGCGIHFRLLFVYNKYTTEYRITVCKKISLYHHHISSLFLKLNSFSMDKSSFYGVKNLAYDIYRKFEIVCLQIGL